MKTLCIYSFLQLNISTNGTNHDDLEKAVVSAQNSSLDFHGKVNDSQESLLRYNSLKRSPVNRVTQKHDKKQERRRRRRRRGGWWIFQCACCSPACCLVVGILTALVLAALAALIGVLMMNKINGYTSTSTCLFFPNVKAIFCLLMISCDHYNYYIEYVYKSLMKGQLIFNFIYHVF